MKKSIFLFFAAILCAMTANAQLYLRGGFNNWNDLTAEYQFVSNVCELELPGLTTYEFKIADSGWGTNFGGNHAFTATATKTLTSGGGNMKITTTIPGTYRFEFVQNTKKLTVTYPELPAPHDITVRAQVPAHWTNDIYAHVWTSENSSGQDVGPLTKNGDYYEVTKNAGALYVIFKNGSAWSNKNQTVDLCYTEDVCLQINQSGSAKATATVIDCGAVAKDITVKAVVPGAWEDKITAWVWPTGGDGEEVTPTKEGNWYVITKNCIELNVIFKNGEGWKGNEHQTANIEGVSENTCYQISAINKDGDGKCTYTVVDCEAAIEPEAKPVDVYTIVGAETLVGTDWDLNNTANDMTKQGDGSYVLVKENVELATTGTYEYKVVKNRSWDWKGVNEGNNLTLTGVDVDGTYNVTFTLNKELNALTASLELVEAKKVIPECYVAGDESLTGQDWNAKSVSMTYDEATEVYTATLTAVPAGTHNMKVVYGGEWLGFDHLATPAPANVKEGDDKKIQFTLAEAGDVTVTYHATNGIGLTGNFAVPAPEVKKYYVKGTHNEWTADATSEMTLDGEVYKKEVTLAADVQFKINDGADAWWGKDNLGDKTYEELEGLEDGNLKMLEEKTFTIIFNPAEHLITFEGLTEIIPTYTVAGNNAAVFGTEWDAENYDNNMTLQDHDGTYVWTKPAVYLAGNVEFKVIKNQNWETAWPSDNYVIDITESAFYSLTIYYNPTNNDITVLTDKLTAQTGSLTLEGVMLEEVDFGGMTLLSLVGHTNDWTSDVNIYLENYTGDNKAYDVYIESAITYNENYSMNQAVSGQLTQTTGADGLRTFTGTLNVAFEGYDIETDESVVLPYQLTLTLVEKSDAATVVVVTDATVTLDAGLTMTGTWTDLGTTYPVLVTVPGFDPSVASAELEAAITVGGEGEFDPWLGFVEGLTTVTVEDGVVEVTGVLENTWAGVKLDVTISGTLPVVPAPEKYTRTVTPGYFGTICLPYGSEDMTGATFFETSHIEGDKVYFNEVTTLVAGHAYIFLASATEIAVVSDGTEVATPEVVNGLHGTFDYIDDVANVSLETEEYIIVYNSTTSQCELSKCGEDCTLEANRAYVVLSEIGTVPVQLMPGCRRIGMSVQGENEATGFENITAPEGQTIKAIVNGQLIIIRNGEKFNAQGVRL